MVKILKTTCASANSNSEPFESLQTPVYAAHNASVLLQLPTLYYEYHRPAYAIKRQADSLHMGSEASVPIKA